MLSRRRPFCKNVRYVKLRVDQCAAVRGIISANADIIAVYRHFPPRLRRKPEYKPTELTAIAPAPGRIT